MIESVHWELEGSLVAEAYSDCEVCEGERVAGDEFFVRQVAVKNRCVLPEVLRGAIDDFLIWVAAAEEFLTEEAVHRVGQVVRFPEHPLEDLVSLRGLRPQLGVRFSGEVTHDRIGLPQDGLTIDQENHCVGIPGSDICLRADHGHEGVRIFEYQSPSVDDRRSPTPPGSVPDDPISGHSRQIMNQSAPALCQSVE